MALISSSFFSSFLRFKIRFQLDKRGHAFGTQPPANAPPPDTEQSQYFVDHENAHELAR
jgi:hypothetical protein